MAENSLTIMSRANQMLAEANTIQKAKELKDLALTAQDWARHKGMGKEAIQHCRFYALLAERRMGEILAATKPERATGAKGNPGGRGAAIVRYSSSTTQSRLSDRLSDMDITKNESSHAQKLAAMPETSFQEVLSGKITTAKAVKAVKAETDRQELAAAQLRVTTDARKKIDRVCDLRVCSCADLFKSGIKPDAVITDPPYPREFLPVFTELAVGCKAAGVPLVAVMSGQTYLPEVLRHLCEHLKYRWTLAYLTPGGQAVQQFPKKINTFWKPVLLFGSATKWIGDVTRSAVNDNDKRFHAWGQSESGMADLVERLTKPGQLVCDPFVGGGTTAVVSLALGRHFVGCDLDGKALAQTRQRIEAVYAGS